MITLPIPAAVAVLVLLAFIAAQIRADQPWPTLKTKGRHQNTDAVSAYRPRPWDEVTADEITDIVPVSAPPVISEAIPYDPLDHRIPLAVVEQVMASFVIADARELEPA